VQAQRIELTDQDRAKKKKDLKNLQNMKQNAEAKLNG
jgi:hypothetical protein